MPIKGLGFDTVNGKMQKSTGSNTIQFDGDIAVGTIRDAANTIDALVIADTTGALTTASDFTVGGNLTVSGTTTTINSTTVQVDDKNIELGNGSNAASAMDGAGITVRYSNGGTPADLSSIQWSHAGTAWGFSHSIGLPSGSEYIINANTVLTETALGSTVLSSSLTSVGTIATGVWQGSAIADAYISSASAWNAKLDSTGAIDNGDFAQFDANGDLLGKNATEVKQDLDIDHLITLSGVAAASDNLGTFTGSTISDNVTIKAAIQALETELESVSSSNTMSLGLNADANGVSEGDVVIIDGSGNVTAASDNSTSYILGVASAAATSGNDVSVYKEGIVIDLGGAFGGTTPAVGDPLFLGTDGQSFTVDAPTSGEVLRVGTVLTTGGKMLFKVQHIMSN